MCWQSMSFGNLKRVWMNFDEILYADRFCDEERVTHFGKDLDELTIVNELRYWYIRLQKFAFSACFLVEYYSVFS